jgi:hypothetical protein
MLLGLFDNCAVQRTSPLDSVVKIVGIYALVIPLSWNVTTADAQLETLTKGNLSRDSLSITPTLLQQIP